jgi:hypothetical protein
MSTSTWTTLPSTPEMQALITFPYIRKTPPQISGSRPGSFRIDPKIRRSAIVITGKVLPLQPFCFIFYFIPMGGMIQSFG